MRRCYYAYFCSKKQPHLKALLGCEWSQFYYCFIILSWLRIKSVVSSQLFNTIMIKMFINKMCISKSLYVYVSHYFLKVYRFISAHFMLTDCYWFPLRVYGKLLHKKLWILHLNDHPKTSSFKNEKQLNILKKKLILDTSTFLWSVSSCCYKSQQVTFILYDFVWFTYLYQYKKMLTLILTKEVMRDPN